VLHDGKIILGVSCYNLRVKASQLNGSNIALKKFIKKEGRSVRVVPNKEEYLSTAQVLHNQLDWAPRI
jgi:CRISPR/Cas system-associated endoribonuclease Cas2